LENTIIQEQTTMSEEENSQIEIQKHEDPAQNTTMQKLKSIYKEHRIAEYDEPKTLDEYFSLYVDMNSVCADIEEEIRRMYTSHCYYNGIATSMDILLDIHGITYDPNSLHDSRRNDKTRWYAKESLFERNVIIRESLRKSDDGLAFVIVKHEKDRPSDKQEQVITKKAAVFWLRTAKASNELIFEITGEKTNYPAEDYFDSDNT